MGSNHVTHQAKAPAEQTLATCQRTPTIFLHEMRDQLAGRSLLEQLLVDQRRLVRGVLVYHEIYVQVGGHGSLDLIQEAAELARVMARVSTCR